MQLHRKAPICASVPRRGVGEGRGEGMFGYLVWKWLGKESVGSSDIDIFVRTSEWILGAESGIAPGSPNATVRVQTFPGPPAKHWFSGCPTPLATGTTCFPHRRSSAMTPPPDRRADTRPTRSTNKPNQTGTKDMKQPEHTIAERWGYQFPPFLPFIFSFFNKKNSNSPRPGGGFF